MPVTRTHTRLAGGFAAFAVAAAVALPAGAGAASSGTASAASGTPAAASGVTARKKCRGKKVAVRKHGKVRCVRKRRAGGDALRDGASRQTQTEQEILSETAPAVEPAEQPALPEQAQSTAPPAAPPENQSVRADSFDELRDQIQGNTYVGGGPRYYRQNWQGYWYVNGWAVRRWWSNSNYAYFYRFEWEYWTGTSWVLFYTQDCTPVCA